MTRTDAAPAVSATSLTVDFGGLRALDAVSVEVPAGQRRAVIGPNGAGKTTLFNVLGGQLRPTAGNVRLFGADVGRLPAHARARLGVARTFQTTTLLGGLTVEENVRIAVAARDRIARATFWRPAATMARIAAPAGRLLERWELSDVRDRRVDEIGYGRQRVLEIVLALAGEPRLLLLDEPTAGLTRRDAELMTGLLERLPADLTLLVIEHDMDVAFALADTVQVMADGAVIATGTPAEVQADPAVVGAYLGAAAGGAEDGEAATRGGQGDGR